MSEKTNFDVLNGKLDLLIDSTTQLNLNQIRMFELLSERSKDVITKEMGGENSRDSSMEGGESIHIASPTDSKPPIVLEHVSGVNLEDNVTVTEQMLMDLTEVTVIAQSGKAFLVLKKGYQKWIPYSQLYDVEERFEDGQFLQNVPLNEKAEKWMHNKPWDKYKAVKNRQ